MKITLTDGWIPCGILPVRMDTDYQSVSILTGKIRCFFYFYYLLLFWSNSDGMCGSVVDITQFSDWIQTSANSPSPRICLAVGFFIGIIYSLTLSAIVLIGLSDIGRPTTAIHLKDARCMKRNSIV